MPRIALMGYNLCIDWQVLQERLQRIVGSEQVIKILGLKPFILTLLNRVHHEKTIFIKRVIFFINRLCHY